MLQSPPHDLSDLINLDANRSPPEDKLERLRSLGATAMQIKIEVDQLEKQRKAQQAKLNQLLNKDLPALFEEAQVDNIGLSDYNVDMILMNYYHANIAADWPEDQREAAFSLIEKEGAGDLIRYVVSVSFNKDEYQAAKKLQEDLTRMGIVPTVQKTIPWKTLTAWLKEQWEKRPHFFTLEILELLGASVGKVVKPKERK